MAVEWFYELDGFRRGPVASGELKKIADSGAVSPETLIWRDGLEEWVKAGAVRGLFATTSPTAVRSQLAAPAQSTATPAAQPAPPQPRPQYASPPAAQPDHGWHPFDKAIELIRTACLPELPTQLSALAGTIGIYGVYAAAALVPLGGLLIAMKSNRLTPIALSLASGFALLVLQYASQRLLKASASAIQANSSVLGSYAVPDCVFVLTVAATVGGALWLLGSAVSDAAVGPAIAAVMLLAVGAFAAMVCIQPPSISVLIKPQCQAGEEALGVLTFLVKLFLRCAPIFFAAGVCYGTFKAAEVVWDIFGADEERIGFIFFQASAVLGLLLGAAAIPIYAYLIMLFYYVTVDVLSAVVAIPPKLDAVREALERDQSRSSQ